MSIKLAGFAKVAGIIAATVALSSPALVSAEPSHGGGGNASAHAEGRGGGGHAVGHAYAGRGYGGRAYAHAYGGARYGAYAGPRAAWGYRAAWAGGWWGGYYWPGAYYGWNYPWFLGVLPLGYATYWWGGIPYYYVNSVYYVWNPADDGYVVTDPPPVDSGSAPAYDASAPGPDDATPPPAPASSSRSPDDVYMYPKNGQSAQQQATDRYECHKWAQEQTGFDPTQSASQSSGNAFDYHRAMVACLQGRGYSVN